MADINPVQNRAYHIRERRLRRLRSVSQGFMDMVEAQAWASYYDCLKDRYTVQLQQAAREYA